MNKTEEILHRRIVQNQKGQIILILILVMTVVLGIGLSIIQRSLTDVSTASKVEQSSRAFSAAEAGIEAAIIRGRPSGDYPGLLEESYLGNQAKADVKVEADLPKSQQALEYPPLSKEEIAHVWLVSPKDPPADPPYPKTTLNVYWGNPGITDKSEQPAIEVIIVYKNASGIYKNKKYFYDLNKDDNQNGFDEPGDCTSLTGITTTLSDTPKIFFCLSTIDLNLIPDLQQAFLLRARLFYNNTPQPFAVEPTGPDSLPKQARLYISTGSSGETQRKVQLFEVVKVVPFYFDYALFAAGEIDK